jgi:hypothetical protein
VLKNIVGDWGADLDDSDYGCALAALGVLESTALMEHRRSSHPAALRNALEREFAFGERTPVWRGAFGSDLITTNELWRQTEHKDAAALALAWREYRTVNYHERHRPRLAVVLKWHERSDLFDFNNLCAWLNLVDVSLDALVLASGLEGASGGPGTGRCELGFHSVSRTESLPLCELRRPNTNGSRGYRSCIQWAAVVTRATC